MKKITSLIISLQLAFSPFAIAQNRVENKDHNSTYNPRAYDKLFVDPLIEKFQSASQIPLESGLSADDPSLDQDPFYLRAQSWFGKNYGTESGSSQTARASTTASVSIPGTTFQWNLNLPLKSVIATDEFIFFAPRENFSDLEKVSRGLPAKGEGLFFVAYSEILQNAKSHTAVPVYFFPMPGDGWNENVKALNFVKEDIVAFANDKDEVILPVNLDDVRTVLKAERFNLSLARAMTVIRMSAGQVKIERPESILPDPGLTAGFGMLFTGINLADQSQNLFAVNKTKLELIASKSIKVLKNLFTESEAHAASLALDPLVAQRLIRVGEVVSFAMLASVCLKYTLYRQHFKEFRDLKPKEGEEIKKLPVRTRLGHEVEDVGDVFAHTLTTFNQFAGVWFADGLEFLGDRYFPKLGSANNTVIRKFLDKTVYFVRGSNDRVQVSGKTWLLGSVVLGGIDTFFVYTQLYGVVPLVGTAIGKNFPALESRVDDAFSLGNPRIANIRDNELVRNAAAYMTAGASSFSSDLQSQILEKTTSEVRAQMISENVDPDASANSAEFKRRLDSALNEQMQKLGLPDKNRFLFDATTLYLTAASLFGYSVPSQILQKKNLESDNFLTSARPGLLISSTKSAVENLRSGSVRSPFTAEALNLLSGTLKDMNIIWNFLRAPVDYLSPKTKKVAETGPTFISLINRFKETRQQMMVLSYEGDLDIVIDEVPESWRGAHPEAIRLAATAFRTELSENIQGADLQEPVFVPASKDRVTRWQELRALRLASEKYLSQFGEAFNSAMATEVHIARFKKIYSETLSNTLGLYPEFNGDADLEQKIETKAASKTESEINRPEVKKFLLSQEPRFRVQFEIDAHVSHYMKTYLAEMKSSDTISAISPAQPGRFQRIRQKNVVRNSVVLTRLLRAAEMGVAGDRIATGRTAFLDRNVPGWHDFKKSNKRTYAFAISRATAIYAFNYFVWGMNLSAAMWALTMVSGFTIGAPAQALTRLFTNQGWKPMGKFSMMGLFAFVYTWATFWGELPVQIFANDFEHYFNLIVRDHAPIVAGATAATAVTLANKERIKAKFSELRTNSLRKFEEIYSTCSTMFQ